MPAALVLATSEEEASMLSMSMSLARVCWGDLAWDASVDVGGGIRPVIPRWCSAMVPDAREQSASLIRVEAWLSSEVFEEEADDDGGCFFESISLATTKNIASKVLLCPPTTRLP
jgi:hypothetical protein